MRAHGGGGNHGSVRRLSLCRPPPAAFGARSDASSLADPFKLHIACTATPTAPRRWSRATKAFSPNMASTPIHADRHQHQHSARDRLRLDPDRRPDRARFPASGGRRPRSRRDRGRLGDGSGRATKPIAAVARTGVHDQGAKDFVGKKVGAPGIGAFLHVLFRKWLIDKGRRSRERQLRRSDLPDHERRAEIGRGRRRADRRTVHSRIVRRERARSPRAMSPIWPAPTRSSPTPRRALRRKKSRGRQGVPRRDRGAAPIVNADRDKAATRRSRNSPRCRSTSSDNPPNLAKPDLKGRISPGGSRR